MEINLIAAMDRNLGIGNKGQMCWSLPPDLVHFRRLTMGKPVVMGRKTAEAIGKPLDGRTNVLITSNLINGFELCLRTRSIQSAIIFLRDHTNNKPEIFLIGGAQIYAEALRLGIVDRMYLTMIDRAFECDTFFPSYDKAQWEEVSRESHKYEGLDFSYITLER